MPCTQFSITHSNHILVRLVQAHLNVLNKCLTIAELNNSIDLGNGTSADSD